jgi:hypothetical protein
MSIKNQFFALVMLIAVPGLFAVPRSPQAAPSSSPATSIKPADAAGDWEGMLNAGAFKLRTVFHITNSPEGLKATIDSPDQNAPGYPASSVQINGSSLRLESEKLHGVFEADELPGLNHLFQTAKTGLLDEYAAIDETIAPIVLEKISGWILKLGVRAAAN